MTTSAHYGSHDLNLAESFAAHLNHLANERFWARYKYKPGHQLSRHNREDVAMMPYWIDIRYQVAREAAERAGQGDPLTPDFTPGGFVGPISEVEGGTPSVGGPFDRAPSHMEDSLSNPFATASEDPLITDINETTWRKFWDQTGYKPGQYLDWSDPADQKMHWPWLRIRFEVVRQVSLARGQRHSASSGMVGAEPAGLALGKFRRRAITAAHQVNSRVVGFVKTTGSNTEAPHERTYGFNTTNEAGSWFANWVASPHAFEYVAYFDKDDPSFPDPVGEQLAGQPAVSVGMNSSDPYENMQSSPPAAMARVPMPYYQRGFIGAEAPAGAQRSGVLAAVAPVLAPATGGFTANVSLDDRQRLHVSICVDGKCYDTSMDLAPAIALVMEKIAREHSAMHASSPAGTKAPVSVSGESAINAIDQAVGAASDALVGALLERHAGVVCGSWLGDIGNALKGAGEGIYKGVTQTAEKLKGPITAVAVSAATAAGGPEAGAAAAKLVGPMIDRAAGSNKPHPQLAAAEQQAQTDPAAAAALSTAQQAVAHTIAAYHVADTAQQAAAGHPESQQHIADVTAAAEQGDPAAHAAVPIIQNAFTNELAKRGGNRPHHKHHHRHPGGGSNPQIDAETDRRYVAQTGYSGPRPTPSDPQTASLYPAWQSIRNQVAQEAAANHGQVVTATASGWSEIVGSVMGNQPSPMIGCPSPSIGGPWVDIVGADAQDAVRNQAKRHAAANPAGVVGVVRTAAGPWLTEGFDTTDDADNWFGIAKHDPTTFVYAAYFEKGNTGPAIVNEAFGHGASRQQQHGPDIQRGIAMQGEVDIIGAAIDTLREQARHIAASTNGGVIGVKRAANGAWSAGSFDTLDDADTWFGVTKHDPASFIYAGYFEKGNTGPAIVNEEIGHGYTPHMAPGGPTMQRGVATTQGEFTP